MKYLLILQIILITFITTSSYAENCKIFTVFGETFSYEKVLTSSLVQKFIELERKEGISSIRKKIENLEDDPEKVEIFVGFYEKIISCYKNHGDIGYNNWLAKADQDYENGHDPFKDRRSDKKLWWETFSFQDCMQQAKTSEEIEGCQIKKKMREKEVSKEADKVIKKSNELLDRLKY